MEEWVLTQLKANALVIGHWENTANAATQRATQAEQELSKVKSDLAKAEKDLEAAKKKKK